MNQVNRPLSWKDHNRFFAELTREIPWVPRFRLWSYYLLLDRKTAKPLKRVLKILTDLAYVVYFLGKCMFFSVFAPRLQFPTGKTLVLLSTSANYIANIAPVIRELKKRNHGCVFIYNYRRKKQVMELYGISADDDSFLLSFERALSTVGRMRSVRNYALGLARACRDLFVFLGSNVPSKRLVGLHFFVWSFYQHIFSKGCTELLSVSRNMVAMNDYFLWESLYYFCARTLPLETYILQHGVLGIAYTPPLTKKYLLWGEIEEAQFTGPLGCSSDGCILAGSPKYDGIRERYIQRKKPFTERKNILFLSSMSSFFPEEYRSEYFKVCEWFFRLSVLDNAEGFKFVFKIHPFENKEVYKDLMGKYDSRVVVAGGDLLEQLLDARVTISHSSTAIYESLVMEVPSIQAVPENLPTSIQLWKWGLTQCASTFEEFKCIALKLMTNDSHYQTTVKVMNSSMDNALINIGYSSEIIADLLEENTGNKQISLSKKSGRQTSKQNN